jgi:hypothetical protein
MHSEFPWYINILFSLIAGVCAVKDWVVGLFKK